MYHRIQHILAAAAVIAAAPQAANAQAVAYGSSSAPVQVKAFDVDWDYLPNPIGSTGAEAPQFIAQLNSGRVALTFVNTSNVPATAVKFIVNTGEQMQNIVDKGTFTSNVPIEHTFPIDRGTRASSTATCTIAEVDFADGSVWHSEYGLFRQLQSHIRDRR